MIIDAHIHVGKWNYPHYRSLEEITIPLIEQLLSSCMVDGALILPSDQKENERTFKDLRKYGTKKYWFFPWHDPRSAETYSFIERYINQIQGIKVHSSLDEVIGGIANSLYEPIIELCRKFHKPIMVHTGRRQETASYEYVIEVAKRYRDVRWIACHLGGDHEELKLKFPKALYTTKLDNVWIDISATREAWTIQHAIQILGTDRLLFGSDYPVMHPRVAIETINVLNLKQEDKDKIFSKNFLSLMG